MERDDMMDRLAAARPRCARVDDDAFDAALLARVRKLPVADGRRTIPMPRRAVALPVAAGVAFAGVAGVMLAGGPDHVGGPSAAQAISSQTLHWLDPPANTILHTRSTETMDGLVTTRDLWQSADDADRQRIVVDSTTDYEQAGDALYDPATDTIYDAPVPQSQITGRTHDRQGNVTKEAGASEAKAIAKKQAEAQKHGADAQKAPGDGTRQPAETQKAPAGGAGKPTGEELPVGDPIVVKVRMLLQDGRMSVVGRELHDGVDAWKVTLNDGLGRRPWTLWVSADDGKPLEIVDPGRDGNDASQVIRWSAYEVLPETDSGAAAQLTLAGAHPSAHLNHDPDAAEAAWNRLVHD